MKKNISTVIFLILALNVFSSEPANNLGRSFSSMIDEWSDLSYINTVGDRIVYGTQDDGTYYIFTFENGVLVEECMMVESTDGFAKMWHNAVLESFYKSKFRTITRTSNGVKFRYSYFYVKVMYFSDKNKNTSLVIYTTNETD